MATSPKQYLVFVFDFHHSIVKKNVLHTLLDFSTYTILALYSDYGPGICNSLKIHRTGLSAKV
jgi:hypothetical protein